MNGVQVDVVRQPNAVVFRLVGAVQIDDGPILEERVREVLALKPAIVVIDLGALTFISSVGMAALVTLHRGMRDAGGRAFIVSPPGNVFGVLDKARIIELMPVYPTVERALATAGTSS